MLEYKFGARLLGRELDEIKEQYAALLPEVESAEEFYELVVKPCLDEFKVNGLSIGHLDALDAAFYNSCVQSLDEYPDDPRIQFRRDELLNPKALQFYRSPIFREGAEAAPLAFYVESNQVIRCLPNTGICFRYDSGLGLNPDGSANSEVGTAPDYECESGLALEYCLDLIEAGK